MSETPTEEKLQVSQEDIDRADRLDDIVRHLTDYIIISNVVPYDDFLGLVVRDIIPIDADPDDSDSSIAISEGLYFIGNDPSLTIYKGLSEDPQTEWPAQFEPIKQRDGSDLGFYQLILDIYASKPLPTELKALIEDFFEIKNDMEVAILANLTTEIIKKLPSKIWIPNTVARNKITSFIGQNTNTGTAFPVTELVDGQWTMFHTGATKELEAATIFMSMRYRNEDLEAITSGLAKKKKLSPQHLVVMDAICALWAYKEKSEDLGYSRPLVITPETIYRLLNGLSENKRVKMRPQLMEKYAGYINDLMHVDVDMDLSDEIRKHHIKDEEGLRLSEAHLSGALIMGEQLYVENTAGEKRYAFSILAKPIPLRYAQAKNQLIEVPLELLDTSDKLRNDEDVAIFRLYLYKQISLMRSSEKRARTIKIDTIYQDTGMIKPEQRAQLKRDRDKIELILESWKDKAFIKDFTQIREGSAQQITGYAIECDYYDKTALKIDRQQKAIERAKRNTSK